MSLFRRSIEIDIDPCKEGVFLFTIKLADTYHDILLTLHVALPEYRIEDIAVDMRRIPRPGCRQIYTRAKALVGMEVGTGFTRNVVKVLGGEAGCPNIVNLILLAAPLAINAAAVLRQQQENLTEDELDMLWQADLSGVCIAYPREQKDGG